MRFKVFLLVAAMLSFPVVLFGQSDSDIESAKAMAKMLGYSESEVNSMIEQVGGGSAVANKSTTDYKRTVKGNTTPKSKKKKIEIDPKTGLPIMPEGEMDEETSAMYAAMSSSQMGVNGSMGVPYSATNPYWYMYMMEQEEEKEETIFGHGIFTNPDLSFWPSYNVPTPKNYILGAGDELIVDIWGSAHLSFIQEISPEGSITVPDLGPVYLAGNTIEQATEIVKGQLARIYSGLQGDNPTTYMRLTLGSIRAITVNVIGEVEFPGTYNIPSLSTIFSAVYMAGGPKETGTVRNISLYRNNKLFKTLDVYDFLRTGNTVSNIRLEENDLIKVNIYENIITVTGQVKRPLKYELEDDETLYDLLALAGGYTATANESVAHVIRRKGAMAQSFDVASSQFSSFKMMDGDEVNIPSNIEENKNSVAIKGAVWYPGVYSISDTLTTLRELIVAAGGVRDEAYLDRGYIERFDKYKRVTALNFSVKDILDGSDNVLLCKDDTVMIFSVPSFEYATTVTVNGMVNAPKTFEYRAGMTLGDAILLCGGYRPGASKANIDIARRKDNDTSMVATNDVATIYNFNLLKDPSGIDFELMPFDIVFVRTAPDYKEQQTIVVNGEVNFPGSYVIPMNTVRLSDVLANAGGLTIDAYPEGAIVTRKMTKDEYNRALNSAQVAANKMDNGTVVDVEVIDTYNIGIDLNKALENPGSHYDLVLKTGDVVSIPKINNTVAIKGGVLYENVVIYDPNMSLKDYIAQAGGYLKYAKKRDVYIVYMNGTVATKKHGKCRIAPGCEIVIPMKNLEDREKMSPMEIVSIATSTASMASTMATVAISIANMSK